MSLAFPANEYSKGLSWGQKGKVNFFSTYHRSKSVRPNVALRFYIGYAYQSPRNPALAPFVDWCTITDYDDAFGRSPLIPAYSLGYGPQTRTVAQSTVQHRGVLFIFCRSARAAALRGKSILASTCCIDSGSTPGIIASGFLFDVIR